jgi:hypothetical protein
MYRVRLINKSFRPAVNNQPLQVSGISGNVYGQSFYEPAHMGMVFLMSLTDYERVKFDLIGNIFAGQQWVPEFFEDDSDSWPRVIERARAKGVFKVGMSKKAVLEALNENAA